jgi:hypothetical protein
MKLLVIPNEVRNLTLFPDLTRTRARFLTSFGMTAFFQSSEKSRLECFQGNARFLVACDSEERAEIGAVGGKLLFPPHVEMVVE